MAGNGPRTSIESKRVLLVIVVSVLTLLSFPFSTALAANPPAGTDKAADSATPDSPSKFQAALENSLTGNRAELSELRSRMAKLEQLNIALLEKLRSYDAEITGQQQMLLMSQITIDNIELAIRNNRASYSRMIQQMEVLQGQYDNTSMLFIKAGEQIGSLKERLSGFMRSEMTESEKKEITSAADALILVLKEKKTLGDQYQKTYEPLLKHLKDTLDKNQELRKTLAARMESELERWLFTPTRIYRQFFSKAFPESLAAMQDRIEMVFKPSLWRTQLGVIKTGGIQRWAFFIFWLFIVVWLHVHFKENLKRIEAYLRRPDCYYRCMGVFLLRRSILYLGMTIVFGIYSSMAVSLLDIHLLQVLFLVFLMLLVTRWGLDYLAYRLKETATPLHSYVSRRLSRLLRLLCVIVIGLILFTWIAGRDNLLTYLAREVVVAFVFIWTVVFWRRLDSSLKEAAIEGIAAPDERRLYLIRMWSYMVSSGGLLMSLAGYKVMSGLWIGAWIKTISVLFWGWVSFNLLREWRQDHRKKLPSGYDPHQTTVAHQLGWALAQLGLVAWLMVMVRGIIWAWDTGGSLILKAREFYTTTYTFGNLNFSLNQIFIAFLILFITRIAVNVGRTLINNKMLVNDNLEPGLKDSISTIMSYCGWGFGILLALATIGINATSLAVVFGALSVGIGFGLQTIFNNFISGLILLFERPIQVGDIVEIGGIWAEVKKINVRATVVQTFDNASVIIPNSEFISQQVTNWSFKDKRMRRSLDIGVAYGSDIELVEKTLSEIAQNCDKVLKYPNPDVIFIDHADSALIFRLRIWVHVDEYWAVPSKLRFEIDKRFRDLGIEIAFPQRDIHIRTMPKEISQKVSPE